MGGLFTCAIESNSHTPLNAFIFREIPFRLTVMVAALANSFIRERQRRDMFIEFFVIVPQLRRSGI